MAQQLADRRDMDFVIWEQLKGEELLSDDLFPGFNKKTCSMLLTETSNLAVKELLPTLKDADEIGVQFKNGEGNRSCGRG